jgi:hypothetical protein
LADTPSVVVELIAQSDVENFGDDPMLSEFSGNSRVIKIQAERYVISDSIADGL